MNQFRTFYRSQREAARPFAPVVDAAGWAPEALGDVSSWSYALTDGDIKELMVATTRAQRDAIAPEAINQENFRLDGLASILEDVRMELSSGRGIVMLQNFPVDELDELGRAIAYLGLGSYLGKTISQNKDGHILGHVKDLGGDYFDPLMRPYKTKAAMQFHSDSCDYVGLLCLNTAKTGGESMVCSSVTVYNRMLERRPDLVEVLTQDFYRSRFGENNPGDLPYNKHPMFTFHEGYFSALGPGYTLEKSQGLPGVPPHTAAQKEAIRVYRETAAECAADIPFTPGDIQLLNNFVTLHARRGYEDWPEESRRRHLLRLWLTDPKGRPVLSELRAGEYSGVLLNGVKPNAPLDVHEVA
jgi:hypothetical protein